MFDSVMICIYGYICPHWTLAWFIGHVGKKLHFYWSEVIDLRARTVSHRQRSRLIVSAWTERQLAVYLANTRSLRMCVCFSHAGLHTLLSMLVVCVYVCVTDSHSHTTCSNINLISAHTLNRSLVSEYLLLFWCLFSFIDLLWIFPSHCTSWFHKFDQPIRNTIT